MSLSGSGLVAMVRAKTRKLEIFSRFCSGFFVENCHFVPFRLGLPATFYTLLFTLPFTADIFAAFWGREREPGDKLSSKDHTYTCRGESSS